MPLSENDVQNLTIDQAIKLRILESGFAIVSSPEMSIPREFSHELELLAQEWQNLPVDEYMKDGGRYRFRRFARFDCAPCKQTLNILPQRPFVQPYSINRFAGDVERIFPLLTETTTKNSFLKYLILKNFDRLPVPNGSLDETWEIGIHQFRVIAENNHVGKPSPEGIHRDGHRFVSIHLMSRQNVQGGDTVIYDAKGEKLLMKYILTMPLDSVYLYDSQIMHGVIPFRQADISKVGFRDILVIDYNLKET